MISLPEKTLRHAQTVIPSSPPSPPPSRLTVGTGRGGGARHASGYLGVVHAVVGGVWVGRVPLGARDRVHTWGRRRH
jgi:hypothetical protein